MTPRITAHAYYPNLNQFSSPASACAGLPIEDILNWLIFSTSTLTPSGIKVVWDLSSFAGAIIRRLPQNVAAELSHPPHRARLGNYKLFYVPEKVFSVNKNGSEANFHDLSQYFPEDPEPKTLDELQEKADQLDQALSEMGVRTISSLSSPVACFKGHELLSNLEDTVPTIFDSTDEQLEAHELALACTPREWISNYQVGHFPELWKYDLSSAYPFFAAGLPDLRDCRIYRAEGTDLNADYGFLVGDFTVYPDHPLSFCSPFLADRGDGTLINFTGTKRNYTCTLDDVRCLLNHSLGKFRFKSGWLIEELNDTPIRPLSDIMSNLYAMREESPLKSHFLKRVMNGIIGRLLEIRKDSGGNTLEYGDLFNPVYHAMITNPTRLRVFDFLVEHGIGREELVHVGVDGIRTLRHLDGIPTSSPMGGWRCAGNEFAFVLSPGGIVSPDRNFKRTGYQTLLTECGKRPTAYRLGVDKKDPIDLSRLFLTQTRGFPSLPRNARALLGNPYLSEPVRLGA